MSAFFFQNIFLCWQPIRDDGGDEDHSAVVLSDKVKEEEEEVSWEVPKDLEDIVAEIVADMDDSPIETDTVSIILH